MTLAAILRLVFLGLCVLLLLALTWWLRGCIDDRELDDRPPEVIQPEDIEEGLTFEPPSVLERVYIRELQPVRSGTAPGVVAAEVDSFVATAIKPAGKKPKFPPVRGEWADGHLTLAVGRSDGALVRNEYECADPCRFWTQDTLMGAETTRAIPRLLPNVLKGAAVCAGVGAATLGIAMLADYQEPVLAGAVGAGACAVVKLVF